MIEMMEMIEREREREREKKTEETHTYTDLVAVCHTPAQSDKIPQPPSSNVKLKLKPKCVTADGEQMQWLVSLF